MRSYKGRGIGVDIFPWEKDVYIVENSADLPFEDKNFDTVTILAALNHIPNREDVLSEVNRILKDDGILIITMIPPEISRIWHFLRKPWDADQTERTMKEGEVYGFKEHNIRNILSRTGFNIVLVKHFMMGINCIYIAKKNLDG